MQLDILVARERNKLPALSGKEMSSAEEWITYAEGFLASDLPGRYKFADKLFMSGLWPVLFAAVVLDPKPLR